MKDITKLIRRFVGILLLSTVLVIVLNIIILAAISASQTANGRPWTTAKETAEALQETETGYVLSGDMTERLSGENAWAIYIDNDTLEVKWHTQNLPDTVPLHYTISDIASLTRGYIDGYPTYTGECENGLVVVGYPKDRYWKHMSPSWDYDFIKNAPYTVLIVIGVNVFLIFLIYMIANSKLLKSVKYRRCLQASLFMSGKKDFYQTLPLKSIKHRIFSKNRSETCKEKKQQEQTGFPESLTIFAHHFLW